MSKMRFLLPVIVLLAMLFAAGGAAAGSAPPPWAKTDAPGPGGVPLPRPVNPNANWVYGPDIPYGSPGVRDQGTVAVDTTGYYSIGGRAGATAYADVWFYNVSTMTWTQKASLPTPYKHTRGCAIGTKIYVPGVSDAPGNLFPDLYIYDTVADSWSTGAPAPTAVYGYVSVCYNGLVYRLGGAGTDNVSVPDVYQYDPATDTWTTLAPMITGRRFHGAMGYNGKIYVAGGLDVNGASLANAEDYDIATNTWSDTDMPDMPNTVWGASVLQWQGLLAMVSGVVDDVIGDGSSRVYNPNLNVWETPSWGSLNTARYRGGGVAVGDTLIAAGGLDPSNVETLTQEYLLETAPTSVRLAEFSGESSGGRPSPDLWLALAAAGLLTLGGLTWVARRLS